MTNYTWYLKSNLDDYAGKWIVIFHEKIVAADERLDVVVKQAEKFGIDKVSLTHIPKKQEALVY